MTNRIENHKLLESVIAGEENDASGCWACEKTFNDGEQVDYVEYDIVFDEGTEQESTSRGWARYFHPQCWQNY